MTFIEKIQIASKVLKARIFKKPYPLTVSFNITYRCNLQCAYCEYRKQKVDELSTTDIYHIIDQLHTMGTKFITLTGGEPLIREDIQQIIQYCKNKKFSVTLNSNGTLFHKKFQEIKSVDFIQFSLDGPKDINDQHRGQGVYDRVIKAMQHCQKEHIKCCMVATLTRDNVSHIDQIIRIAEQNNIGVYFQPVTPNLSGNARHDMPLMPPEDQYKKAIQFLLEEKKSGCKAIHTSTSALKHLYHWPHPKKLFCSVRLCHFFIEPDGKIFWCDNFPNYQDFLIPPGKNIKNTYRNLSEPHACNRCWASSLVEFNLALSPNLDSLWNIWKRI